MNDTFNLSRFAQLAYKHYWENKIKYLICILLTIAAMFLLSPVRMISFGATVTSDKLAMPFVREFETIRLFVVPLFCYVVASIGARAERRRVKMTDLLLPCSNLERFLFILLHSTVVAFLAAFVVYYGTSLFLESHLYIDGQNNIVKLPIINIGERFDLSNCQRIDVVSAERFFNFGLMFKNALSLRINILGYSAFLMLASIAIWNNISFKNGFWGAVLHLAMFFGLVWGLTIIDMIVIPVTNSVVCNFDPLIADLFILYPMPLLFAAAYLYSSYQRFKRF